MSNMWHTLKFEQICKENDFNSLYSFLSDIKKEFLSLTGSKFQNLIANPGYLKNIEQMFDLTEKVVRKESSLIGDGFINTLPFRTKLSFLEEMLMSHS